MAQQLGSNYYNSPYKFNGKELDEETGLYYYGARYYDPKVSIWLSVDPKAETSRRWNPYAYCYNNPLRFVDPDGMKAVENDDWIVYQGQSGQTQVIYDEGVKTRAEAELKYNNVSDFFKSGSISGTDQNNTSYSYKLNDGGTVTDTNTNTTVETGFTTPNGTYVGENKGTISQLAPIMQSVGDGLAAFGYALTLTGIGAEIGVPLAAIGNGLSTLGTTAEISVQINNNDYDKAGVNAGFMIADKLIEKGLNKVLPGSGNINDADFNLDKAILTQGASLKTTAINKLVCEEDK